MSKKLKETIFTPMYYTPSIEEFHVGFEYELFDTNTNIIVWYKKQFDYEYELQYFNELIKKNKIRLKYLDSSDIESLDWMSCYVIDGTMESASNLIDGFELNDYILQYAWKENFYLIYKRNRYDESNKITGNWEQKNVFIGIIKNKSELKRVMHQVGILK